MIARQITHTLLLVLKAIIELEGPAYGLQIANRAGIERGVAYPILGRLQGTGVLTARWENVEPTARPPRKYYTLVPERRAEVVALLAKRGIDMEALK